jgi:hypothetical protein
MLLAFSGFAVACEQPGDAPEITISTVEESVATTLELSVQCADNAGRLIVTSLGPQADSVVFCFQLAISDLNKADLDTTEMQALYDETMESYVVARKLYFKGMLFAQLANVFATNAADVEGTEAYAMRVKAAACYYEAATYMEDAAIELETVLELGDKGQALMLELLPVVEDDVEVVDPA